MAGHSHAIRLDFLSLPSTRRIRTWLVCGPYDQAVSGARRGYLDRQEIDRLTRSRELARAGRGEGRCADWRAHRSLERA